MQDLLVQLFPLGLRDVRRSSWSRPAPRRRLLDLLRRALAGLLGRARRCQNAGDLAS